MSTSLAPLANPIESALMQGDLSKLSPPERLSYYKQVCASLNLNPLTRPFEYITLNAKLTLYATRNCTEQLRNIHGVSITSMNPQKIDELFVVTVTAQDKTGRTDSATGAVSIADFKGQPLKGEALANAMMKAETKAKRRVTLSLCGLGLLDESEVETLKGQGIAQDGPRNDVPPPALPIAHALKESRPQAAPPPISDSHIVMMGSMDGDYDVPGDAYEEYAPIPLKTDNYGDDMRGAMDHPIASPKTVAKVINQRDPGHISEKQSKRFWAIATKAGKTKEQVVNYLGSIGYEDSQDMPWGKVYNAAVEWASQ